MSSYVVGKITYKIDDSIKIEQLNDFIVHGGISARVSHKKGKRTESILEEFSEVLQFGITFYGKTEKENQLKDEIIAICDYLSILNAQNIMVDITYVKESDNMTHYKRSDNKIVSSNQMNSKGLFEDYK